MAARSLGVLTLLATSVTGHDEVPKLWSVQPGDPDNADREYGNGDIFTIVIGQHDIPISGRNPWVSFPFKKLM